MRSVAVILTIVAMAPAVAVDREDMWVVPDMLLMDHDGDGIADQNDNCVDTATGKIVDFMGCELPVDRFGQNPINIRFDYDQSVVKPEYFSQLQGFADMLSQQPELAIELSGHTDARGSDEYNQALSERRSNAVAQVLIERFGVNPAQLFMVGYSEGVPLAIGETELEWSQNRRVQAQLTRQSSGVQFVKNRGSE